MHASHSASLAVYDMTSRIFERRKWRGGLFLLLLTARKTHVLTFYDPAHSLALPLPPHWGPSTCYLLPQTPLHTGPRKTTTQATAIIHRGTRYCESIKPARRIWSTECSLRRTAPLMSHKSTSSCCEEFGCMLSVGAINGVTQNATEQPGMCWMNVNYYREKYP